LDQNCFPSKVSERHEGDNGDIFDLWRFLLRIESREPIHNTFFLPSHTMAAVAVLLDAV